MIPLYVCTAVGMLWSGYYTLRLAIKNPDVSWAKKSNPEPWNEYANKQYKVSVVEDTGAGDNIE